MTNLLIKLFIKNSDETRSPAVRERFGKLAGIVGICSNLLLFLAKLAIGFFSGSISIMADAMNNLTDSASSAITLAGFKLAGMPADEQHPYGHARFEYISGLAVSFLILVIGYQFFMSSLQKVLHPEAVEFTWAVAIVLVISILVKLWQGIFNRKIGNRIDSAALSATAADSRNDVITTFVVLLGAIVGHFTGFLIDGIMGIIVAIFIVVSGIRLVGETISPLLGMAPDNELVTAITKKIMAYDSVLGMHDLMVHNYGPHRCFASVHVEVPATQDIMVSHDIIDCIERDFSVDMQIELVVHLDPIVTDDEHTSAIREFAADTAKQIDAKISIHDFRMVEMKTHTNLIFDVSVPPRFKLSDAEIRERFSSKLKTLSDVYYCVITVDRSYTYTTQKNEVMD